MITAAVFLDFLEWLVLGPEAATVAQKAGPYKDATASLTLTAAWVGNAKTIDTSAMKEETVKMDIAVAWVDVAKQE